MYENNNEESKKITVFGIMFYYKYMKSKEHFCNLKFLYYVKICLRIMLLQMQTNQRYRKNIKRNAKQKHSLKSISCLKN